MDIFYARKDSIGNWTTPKNIGIPINTSGDDLGFFVSTDGHLGYFASNLPSRVKGKSVGKYDIYSFELYKDARPDDVAFFTGKIEDKSNGTDKNFTVEVKDAVTKKVTEALVDTTSGEYTVIVNTKIKNDLVITAKKDNYAFSSQLVLKDSIKSSKPVKVNVVVDTIKVGQGYTLNNIYYKTNSDDLEQQSIAVIEEFSEYLKSNPKIKIEVWGHTDNVGNDQANAKLSTDRAFSVREMLIAKGVNKVQLIDFKGWGATKPISDNYTELGKAKNRRTEFMIISK
jgi:outer membrane protein OmpA-like peptidoglycan-associated protein